MGKVQYKSGREYTELDRQGLIDYVKSNGPDIFDKLSDFGAVAMGPVGSNGEVTSVPHFLVHCSSFGCFTAIPPISGSLGFGLISAYDSVEAYEQLYKCNLSKFLTADDFLTLLNSI